MNFMQKDLIEKGFGGVARCSNELDARYKHNTGSSKFTC